MGETTNAEWWRRIKRALDAHKAVAIALRNTGKRGDEDRTLADNVKQCQGVPADTDGR